MKITLHNQAAGQPADTIAIEIAQQALDEGWEGRVGVVHGTRTYGVQVNKAGVSVWPQREG